VKRFVIAHGNYLKPKQWQKLHASASVVYCPRTHSAFGHEPHPYQGMLNDGVIVALGTDSLASNPDLSVWNEARFLFHQGVEPQRVLEMLTINGAKALGLGEQFGTLDIGKRADVVCLPACDDSRSVYQSMFEGHAAPELVFRNGRDLNELN